MFPARSLSVLKRLTLTVDWVWAHMPVSTARIPADDQQRDVGRPPLRLLVGVADPGHCGEPIAITRWGCPLGVLGVVLGQQLDLSVVLREHEEHQRRAEDDRDDPGDVGPVGAVDERGLRRGGDLLRVLRVLAAVLAALENDFVSCVSTFAAHLRRSATPRSAW